MCVSPSSSRLRVRLPLSLVPPLSHQELDYKHYKLFDCAAELPLAIFSVMPPKERGIIVMNVQIQSESHISVVFSGATYPFRQKLYP